MDDGGKGQAGRAPDRAGTHRVGKLSHGSTPRLDSRGNRLTLGLEGGTIWRAQGRMQDRPALRQIDHLAAKEPRPRRIEIRRLGQTEGCLKQGLAPRLFGQV